MEKTLKEKLQDAISETYTLNMAIKMIEDAKCRSELTAGIKFIPEKTFGKIINEMRQFLMNDMTRKELVELLKKQLELRKRSARRYLRLASEESENTEN